MSENNPSTPAKIEVETIRQVCSNNLIPENIYHLRLGDNGTIIEENLTYEEAENLLEENIKSDLKEFGETQVYEIYDSIKQEIVYNSTLL